MYWRCWGRVDRPAEMIRAVVSSDLESCSVRTTTTTCSSRVRPMVTHFFLFAVVFVGNRHGVRVLERCHHGYHNGQSGQRSQPVRWSSGCTRGRKANGGGRLRWVQASTSRTPAAHPLPVQPGHSDWPLVLATGSGYVAPMTPPISRCPYRKGPTSPLAREVEQEVAKTLEAFGKQPSLAKQQAEIERGTAGSGYAHRQLYELVQNSADAIRGGQGGRILIRLTGTHLYCADDGKAITLDGVKALMFSRLSPKSAIDEIGRFGLGFKSVLRVTDSPDFISCSVSLSFDKGRAEQRLRQHLTEPLPHYPVFPLPEVFDPTEDPDESLQEMMKWAKNIVRLPLKPGSRNDLRRQLEDFPPEFLLFVDHVKHLTLEADDLRRNLVLTKDDDGVLNLSDSQGKSNPGPGFQARWRCFKTIHTLSAKARSDAPAMDDNSGKVPIWWAAPFGDGTRQDGDDASGMYWAFFPTKTASLLGGILNAPWRTNSDRQNLLEGTYNDELVDVAASLVDDSLRAMSTSHDPAAHLDLLPRRHEPRDTTYSDRLRDRLSEKLPETPIVPDQDGCLRKLAEVKYPPDLPRAVRSRVLAKWEECAWRPREWLHHSAITRDRLAKIDRLYSGNMRERVPGRPVPRESLACWMESIVEDRSGDEAVEASKTAIHIAAVLKGAGVAHSRFGEIVLTQSGEWKEPGTAEVFFLKEDEDFHGDDDLIVHCDIARDPRSSGSLAVLGVSSMSATGLFEAEAKAMLDAGGHAAGGGTEGWDRFWQLAREIGPQEALRVINELSLDPCVHTIRGTWQRLRHTLLPGRVVPHDGTRDAGFAIDTAYHHKDMHLLRRLGASDGPRGGVELASSNLYWSFLDKKRFEFCDSVQGNPRAHYFEFDATQGSGPLDFLECLSEEGKARYTMLLLGHDDTYALWTMYHRTQPRWGKREFESLTVHAIQEHGLVAWDRGFATMHDLRTSPQEYASALLTLMAHPKAEQIRDAFDLEYPHPEPIGDREAGALVDVWPALRPHLSADLLETRLVRCRGFEERPGSPAPECVHVAPILIVVGKGNDLRREVRLVSHRLNLELSDEQIETIVRHNVYRDRNLVRQCSSDEERLLLAVGVEGLRSRLGESVLAAIKPLSPTKIAKAAIARYHTGALKEYQSFLAHLDPPSRWAGSAEAREFVRSLGFPAEWAGERGRSRHPFREVNAPYSLPELHCYQVKIVANIHKMLLDPGGTGADRRGMMTLPTGSGKTRAAVEGIVTAMDKGLDGSVLWIAEREELCEQAVQAWCQVWSGVGPRGQCLRVSRMWGGQPLSGPGRGRNVVVTTPQTLKNKVNDVKDHFDFSVVVFDEAHRSTAPMATSVMEELGLTRWKRSDEIFLIGLTATPYRGRSVSETNRLASRYGRNRLDDGAFCPTDPESVVRRLQEDGILAKVDHATVEGAGDFTLTGAERDELDSTPHHAWLPRKAEQRLAADQKRNERIVGAYMDYVADRDPTWPTLIFATSVEHSHTIATLLNLKRIRARSVSGETDTYSRRQVVEEFRRGEVQVLVNYRVFAEGFDAPNTRVIMVARPVYSPNLYFQMIGRGLRGPKNGGNERCLIINVEDNIKGFGRELAFSELEWLWDR